MKRLGGAAAFVLGVIAAACGGKIGEGDAGTDAGNEGASATCCPPSAQPECCMSFGGAAQGNACSKVCDGMPSPSEPGWHLQQDSSGCSVWIPPTNAASFCGEKPPPPDASTGCAPALGAWSPQIDAPFFLHADMCSAAQLQEIYGYCFASNANAQQCQSVMQKDATCAGCLLTARSAAKWGALLELPNGIIELDVAGCIADATGDGSCAQKESDLEQCGEVSCDACFAPDDPQSFQEYEQCLGAANGSTCAKYAAAACANEDAGAGAQCFPTDFKDAFFTYGALFCGP